MEGFDEARFRQQVDTALTQVRKVLETNRKPGLPEDVPHTYSDKFRLADFVSNSSLGALLTSLEFLGLDADGLKTLSGWAETRSITLRWKADQECIFNREVEREVEGDKHVTKIGALPVYTHKNIYKVTEWFWNYTLNYELFAYRGNEPDRRVVLHSHTLQYEIMTTSKNKPQERNSYSPIDVDLSWIFKNLKGNQLAFSIDRQSPKCKTPRRNPEVYASLAFFHQLKSWLTQVNSFISRIFTIQASHGYDLTKLSAPTFLPVFPLFERAKKLKKSTKTLAPVSPRSSSKDVPTSPRSKDGTSPRSKDGHSPRSKAVVIAEDSACLSMNDLGLFLKEQRTSIESSLADVKKMFPAGDAKNAYLISQTETGIVVILNHLTNLATFYGDSIDYLEDMLYKQFQSAIGKIVGPVDFANYMKYHNLQLFNPQYTLKPFCFAIRRPDHSPEGVLSIEAKTNDPLVPVDPIFTIAAQSRSVRPMRFPISASTSVTFTGQRFLHGWIDHQFSGSSCLSLTLSATSRQFSSYILLLGAVASKTVFEPEYALIIKDQDDWKVPLILETIPTPQEFQDAIESLSPEQQRFAKAYRSMQLSSTLFAVATLQIKPMLEKVLKLDYDSLTKEIKLTQDLMKMFLEYQIPSDLLSYSGPDDASKATKIQKVRSNVTAIQEMIKVAEQEELEEMKRIREQKQREELQVQYSLGDEFLESLSHHGLGDRESLHRFEKNSKPMKKSKKSGGASGFLSKPSGRSTEHSIDGSISSSWKSEKESKRSGAVGGKAKHSKLAKSELSGGSSGAKPSEPAAQKPSSELTKSDAAKQIVVTKPEGDDDTILDAVNDDEPDYTEIPPELDAKFLALDVDAALRPTILKPSTVWTRKSRKNLLTPFETTTLDAEALKLERNKAFDLIDAVSKSGAIVFDDAQFHVVVASTYCFDKSLIDTIIQDNVNPIEKVERSMLIVATTMHQKEATELVRPDQVERVKTYSPGVFLQQ